jgi:exodeoxyribonuclease V beta subunit
MGTQPAGSVPPCNLFLEAPAGASVGTAIHEWIEEWDFGDLDEQALRAHLARHRLGLKDTQAPDMTARTVDMLTHLAGSVLQGFECTIAEACPAPHASEWHFNLPIRGSLTTEGFARAFRAAGGPGLASYATMIEAIPSARLAGLLQGFIDRLAFHEGRWGVIDWKTNRLGTTPDAYGESGLLQCALNEHYLLQAHLYLVALRRHLRLTDPAAMPAGAWLVFLRAAHAGSHDGVLHINPGEALLDALDALFA